MADIIQGIAQAIARYEGFYNPGSVAARNNNPGNLRPYTNTQPSANGFRVFDTLDEGWRALIKQIELNISRGLNLYEFFAGKDGVYGGYAPSGDRNNPRAYAEFVAQQVGIDPTIALNRVAGIAGTVKAVAIGFAGTALAALLFIGVIWLYIRETGL